MAPGESTSCGRISIPPTKCRWRTTSPLRSCCRARVSSDLDPEYPNPSVKLVVNCETLLFQRPDDAIHRGSDKQAEADIASPGTFLSNFEPFTVEQAARIVDHVVEFDKYTEPMKDLLREFRRRIADRVMSFRRRIRGWWMEAVEESALSAKAAGPGESAARRIWRKLRRAWSAKFRRTSRCISR